MPPRLRIRSATPDDGQQLAALLNGVVAEGDKTAIAEPFDAAKLNEWFITGAHCLSCLVAEASDGALVGFQALECFDRETLLPGMADIGTFIAPEARRKGIGLQLTDVTIQRATSDGINVLRAVVRKDNLHGQAFYSSCGFSVGTGLTQSSDDHNTATVLVRTIGK